jgi:hypothetical protein
VLCRARGLQFDASWTGVNSYDNFARIGMISSRVPYWTI